MFQRAPEISSNIGGLSSLFEFGLKIIFHGGGGGWVGGGGWPEQMGIRLTSASTGVGVEVGAELGNFFSYLPYEQHSY